MSAYNKNSYTNLYDTLFTESGRNQSVTQNLMAGLGGFKSTSLRDYTSNAYSLNGALVSLWTQAVTTRNDYYTASADLRKFYLVDALINLIAADVLNPDEHGDIIRLESDDNDIKEELHKFQNKWDMNVLLKDIIRDFVDYGEVTLSMKAVEGEGVVDIADDVNQLNVVAFYEDGTPKRFLLWDDNDFEIKPAHEFVHFVNGSDKLRVKLEVLMQGSSGSSYNNFGRATSGLSGNPMTFASPNYKQFKDTDAYKDLPDYVRIGKPIFYGAIEKLRQLQLLEQLIPAAKLNEVSQSQLVAVKIPAAASPQEISEIIRHFESIMNPPVGFNGEQRQMSLAEVMNSTGKIRLIPCFMDDKGALERLDIRKNQSVDDLLAAVQDLRKIILSSLGIPPSLLFGPDAEGGAERSKAQEMHLFSRYTRRLADIQFALAQGIKQIALTHLVNRGIKVRKSDVSVVFINRMVDLSGLEQLEFNDTKQAMVSNLFALAKTIVGENVYNAIVPQAIDKRNLVKWLKQQTDLLTNGLSIFQDPEKIDFEHPMGGADAAAGGGGAMPMSDFGANGMGGGDNSSVPLPDGVSGDAADQGGGGGAGAPDMQGRMGAPAPGSGDVNVSAK